MNSQRVKIVASSGIKDLPAVANMIKINGEKCGKKSLNDFYSRPFPPL